MMQASVNMRDKIDELENQITEIQSWFSFKWSMQNT
jgi:hypothetical protein